MYHPQVRLIVPSRLCCNADETFYRLYWYVNCVMIACSVLTLIEQYFATNIGNGSHSLTITNIANGNATYLDVDQIGIWRSPSWSNSTSNSSSSALSTPISGSANPSNLHVQQADAGNAR